jgi:hypothetical protein
MQDNRRFSFIGMGQVYVYLANLYAMVAPVADIRMENHRRVRGD